MENKVETTILHLGLRGLGCLSCTTRAIRREHLTGDGSWVYSGASP